jgi:hypothetical protein
MTRYLVYAKVFYYRYTFSVYNYFKFVENINNTRE